MAVWEARRQVTAARWWNVISQVSWTDGTAQDVYYWLDHSFQYADNINCDDEMHGIKLANRVWFTSDYSKCQLVSLWDNWVMSLPVDVNEWETVRLKRFEYKGYYATTPRVVKDSDAGSVVHSDFDATPWVVFQDYFWFGSEMWSDTGMTMMQVPLAVNAPWHWVDRQIWHQPFDHNDYTDESISSSAQWDLWLPMSWRITAILNYNNTRLVVACGSDIWVYYPELDRTNPNSPLYSQYYNDQNPPAATDYWKTGWKKTLTFEAWVTIVALTCTFEYLKIWAVDEWWNTKVYYYQGNNNLRSTFVYNVVDLTGVRVLHVYSINWIDYYTSSIGLNASDALIDFHKMIWATPVKLFSQRAGLSPLDINTKAPYFVWPTSISWAYNDGNIYIADAYGVFKFRYNPSGFDKWYMKWKLNDSPKQVYWLCENKGFLYVSTEDGCYAMRLYDTWVDWYQEKWVLISREFEWREWGSVTKMMDEVRMNFELNPLTNQNWDIDVFISPNNLWRDTDIVEYQYEWTVNDWEDLPVTANKNEYYLVKNAHETNPEFDAKTYVVWKKVSWVWKWVVRWSEAPSLEDDWWYKAMHIDQRNWKTRAEKSNLLNDMGKKDGSSFKFDWQTITYAIKITRWEEEKATPIVREIRLAYHCKDKVNNVYDITND